MKFKEGVSLDGVRPQILSVLPAVEELFDETAIGLTITCSTGGHGHIDPHTWGFAVDCRTHGLSPDRQEQLRDDLQDKIGPTYYVKLEDPGGPNEHIHIQVRLYIWRQIVRSEGHADIPAL